LGNFTTKLQILTSSCPQFSSVDALLGGGLRQGQLTEITGQSSSGKTQVKMLTTSIFLNLLDAIDRYTFYMLTPPDKIGLPKTVGF
jgi:archaellum biogenesis ATPase FlaH